MAATRKVRSAKKVLKVDSTSKIPDLEKLLKSGKLTVILVYADWCGACQRFKKDIWEPMCKEPASNNRAAVRDDMLSQTSLSSAKVQYLPSILMVDEKGTMSEMPGPKGEPTNAIPTPRTLEEMKTVVNVNPTPGSLNSQQPSELVVEDPIPKYLPTKDPLAEVATPARTATPAGNTYEPSPQMVSPLTLSQKGGGIQGGRFLQTLRSLALGKTRLITNLTFTRKRKGSKKSRRRRG